MEPHSQPQHAAQRLRDFYQDRTVLVTGATGFVGKVALVKLVRSLNTCRRVYVMLRPKRGLTPQQRFNKMLAEEPFVTPSARELATGPPSSIEANSKLAAHEPELKPATTDWSKVVAVEGDMCVDELGFNQDTKLRLMHEVELVFNIAASVSFDAPLKQNLRDNYLGTRNLLQLATHFRRLVSFVHVSTFFVNSHLEHIEERVLPMNRDCEKMAELISWLPEQLCDSIADQIMEQRPNTYIFTKAMTENLVLKYQHRLPLAIVRPSIVTPSAREPYPGWVDNVNGPMGLGVLAALGILRNIDWNYWGVCDLIPVDVVVNCMLAVAERTSRKIHESRCRLAPAQAPQALEAALESQPTDQEEHPESQAPPKLPKQAQQPPHKQQQQQALPNNQPSQPTKPELLDNNVDFADHKIIVYNCSSSSLKPITWGQGFEVLRKESALAPPYKMLRTPITVPQHRRANRLGFALSQLSELLFAYFIDFILTICGQKPVLTKLTAKLHHGYKMLLPFTTTQYSCSNDNLEAAFAELQPEDQQEFHFDVKQLDWERAFRDSYYGARRRLLKEDISNVPAAIFKYRVLVAIELLLKTLLAGLLLWQAYKLAAWAAPGGLGLWATSGAGSVRVQ